MGRPLQRSGAGYIAAVLVVALATTVGWPLYHKLRLANTNVLMLYLLGVLWIATRYTRGPAVVASVLGVAAFDFTFVPPYYAFTFNDQQYIVTFAAMLATALVISALTLRVRTQADAARQAWERVETEYLRNTLLSGVSHDLRTPLAGITGAASALIESGDQLSAEAQREMLETIASEAARMEHLVENLLDMTRLESGGLALKLEWQTVSEIVGSTLRHMDRRLRGRTIRTSIPDDLPMAHVDSVAIEQVLVNLIDNAVEYTPADALIEIAARIDDRQLLIEISDRGPGLPKGSEERIFQKFVRFHPQPGRRGIGLGLAICRGIVEAHGGSIRAINREGGGATFRIALPLKASPPIVAELEAIAR